MKADQDDSNNHSQDFLLSLWVAAGLPATVFVNGSADKVDMKWSSGSAFAHLLGEVSSRRVLHDQQWLMIFMPFLDKLNAVGRGFLQARTP